MRAAGGAAPASDVIADVVVIGGGIVGLATALALADRDVAVALLTTDRPGAAARAAAGLLVPHYRPEGVATAAERFMVAGRDLYPGYVRSIAERSGLAIAFQPSGAIELARSPGDLEALRRAAPPDAEILSADAVARLEPALAATNGALLHPHDGAVDNARLTDALASIVAQHPRVRTVYEAAARLEARADSATVHGAAGTRVGGARVVLAAGAWSGTVHGIPRALPVRPVRGQLCTVRGAPLRHVVLAPDVYIVTRGADRTLVGSTMEEVGFDVGTTPTAIEGLRRAAAAACPALRDGALIDAWSGLRPVTPDLLPILGPDPDDPALLYACGHSRNGILLAPITALVTCATVLGETPPWDIASFGIGRFRTPGEFE